MPVKLPHQLNQVLQKSLIGRLFSGFFAPTEHQVCSAGGLCEVYTGEITPALAEARGRDRKSGRNDGGLDQHKVVSFMLNNPNINVATLRVACSNCNLRELCLPLGLTLREIERLEELVSTRKRVKRGEALYRAGDKFEALYAIRLGFLKSAVTSSDGREQVTSFHMSGDIVGLDGLAGMVYSSDLIALEDTEVCILPYDRLIEITQSMPAMSMHFQKLLSMEIVRQNGVMLLLGSMHAEERLAAFILNLSQRFEQRGYSRSEFVLRMTRAEIGSYLGLKLETVSRVLSRFSHDNLIVVNQKHVQIMDFEGLRAIVSGQNLSTGQGHHPQVPIRNGIEALISDD